VSYLVTDSAEGSINVNGSNFELFVYIITNQTYILIADAGDEN
jgi:hypothetical protein